VVAGGVAASAMPPSHCDGWQRIDRIRNIRPAPGMTNRDIEQAIDHFLGGCEIRPTCFLGLEARLHTDN
jgi:hypothetical protein